MKRVAWLIVAVVLFLIATAAMFLPDNDQPRMVKFLILSQVMFVLSIIIWRLARAYDLSGEDRRVWRFLLLAALLARGIMLFGPGETCYLSDDIYRYIWDGKQVANGINPYLHSPRAEEVTHLRDDDIWPKINHPWLPTIYPPMAQNIFLVTYLIGGDGTFTFKVISALFELLTIMTLLLLLRWWRLPRAHILLYLFAPIVLIEFYQSAHLDILALPFLVLALVSLARKRAIWVGVFLGLAAMMKLYGLFFVPVLFFYLTGRDRWHFAVALTGTILVCYAPYLVTGGGAVLGSLGTYLGEWQFNGSVYWILKSLFGSAGARWFAAGLFVAWLGFVVARKVPVSRKLFDSFAGYLILTPTFFPWYFVWLYPMLLKHRSAAFLWLSGTCLLSYHVLIGQYSVGTWTPMVWLGVISYGPFYLLLLGTAVRNYLQAKKERTRD